MGTRSITKVNDEQGYSLVTMYRQMDGYPAGHGQELADFLAGFTMVNGLSLNEERKVANGAGCLAAQIVAHFKEGPGGIYLYPAGTVNVWEDYIYEVSFENGEIMLRCTRALGDSRYSTLFYGPLSEFDGSKLE